MMKYRTDVWMNMMSSILILIYPNRRKLRRTFVISSAYKVQTFVPYIRVTSLI